MNDIFMSQKKLQISFLSFVFFFSGFASLMYQVVWQRLLTLYYGVGAVSIALIVSIYMFGLGLGALAGGFLAERIIQRIKLYFLIEILIGIFGLISLPFLGFLGKTTAGSSYVTAFFYMFLFLAIPTFLMGMTLPLLTKIFNRLIQDFLETVSFLYFINTLGGAIGALFATYVIITFWGLDVGIYVAATINFILAIIILYLAYFYQDQKEPYVSLIIEKPNRMMSSKRAYFFVFITGFLAIGYEIIWFRVLEVLTKASAYTFSTCLAVYLSGIAIGSLLMQKYLKRPRAMDQKKMFYFLQFLIGCSVAFIFISYYYLTKYTPLEILTRLSFSEEVHPNPFLLIMPAPLFITKLQHLYVLLDDFIWPFIFIFLPTLLMGASFPLIAHLTYANQKEGKTVATIYFFNTLGNILGGIITGFFLLAYLGTEQTVLLFSLVGLLFGLLVFKDSSQRWFLKPGIILVLGLVLANLILFPQKGEFYRLMHFSKMERENFKIYLEEGINGVVVTYLYGDYLDNYINGLHHGGRPGYHFYYKAIEAASFANKVDNILIIGFGTGSILEAILKMDEVKNITVVELNGTLIKNLMKMPLFRNMLDDPRVHLIIDDGRRFLLRTDQKFDLILMDALRGTTAYSNNIYSKEAFELIKSHLAEGGNFMVWLTHHQIVTKTVIEVFDYTRIYGSFALASNTPFHLNQRGAHLLEKFSPEERKEIIRIANLGIKELGGTNAGKYLGPGIRRNYHGLINQDWKPVSEYYLRWAMQSPIFKRLGKD